ncbi:HAD family phosphatase, partial [bacterium]
MTPNNHQPAVIFDFGGVLIEWDPFCLYGPYFNNDRAAMQRFLDEIGFTAWNARQDAGRPFAEGVAELSAQFPQHAPLIRAYHERWEETIVGPIEGTVEILHALKQKGYPLYALSNWSAET